MRQPPAHPTILVVEDDADTREFYIDLLSLYGYQTIIAPSGHAALTKLDEQRVNLVLLDRRLPDMDGLNVCRRIRAAIDTTVPIIMLTADYSIGLDQAAFDAGVTAYISKPFSPDKLIEQIAALVQP